MSLNPRPRQMPPWKTKLRHRTSAEQRYHLNRPERLPARVSKLRTAAERAGWVIYDADKLRELIWVSANRREGSQAMIQRWFDTTEGELYWVWRNYGRGLHTHIAENGALFRNGEPWIPKRVIDAITDWCAEPGVQEMRLLDYIDALCPDLFRRRLPAEKLADYAKHRLEKKRPRTRWDPPEEGT